MTTCYNCFQDISDGKVIFDHDCMPFCSHECSKAVYDKVNNVQPKYTAYCPNCGKGMSNLSSNKISDVWFCSLECLESYGQRRLREEHR